MEDYSYIEIAHIIGTKEQMTGLVNTILENTHSAHRFTETSSVEQMNEVLCGELGEKAGRFHTLSFFLGKEEKFEDICPKKLTLPDGREDVVTLENVKYLQGFQMHQLSQMGDLLVLDIEVNKEELLTIGLLFEETPHGDDVMAKYPQFEYLFDNWDYDGLHLDWWCDCHVKESDDTVLKRITMEDEEGKNWLISRFPHIYEPIIEELKKEQEIQNYDDDCSPF